MEYTRREIIKSSARYALLTALAGIGVYLGHKSQDSTKTVSCNGRCAECVSAANCEILQSER